MNIPDWNPDYSVGNDILDNQHKKLLALCKDAATCMKDDTEAGDKRFHLVLDELFKYSKDHFSAEEDILKSINYPNLNAQLTEHLDYVEKLAEYLYKASSGLLDKAGVSQFVSDWWHSHILESDMQFKSYLLKS